MFRVLFIVPFRHRRVMGFRHEVLMFLSHAAFTASPASKPVSMSELQLRANRVAAHMAGRFGTL